MNTKATAKQTPVSATLSVDDQYYFVLANDKGEIFCTDSDNKVSVQVADSMWLLSHTETYRVLHFLSANGALTWLSDNRALVADFGVARVFKLTASFECELDQSTLKAERARILKGLTDYERSVLGV
jgi:hypothetical protein